MHRIAPFFIAAVIGSLAGCHPLPQDDRRDPPPSVRELPLMGVPRPYWRVFETREGCYIRPRSHEQELLPCEEAIDLAHTLNRELVFEYRVTRPTRDVVEAIITPYPLSHDILLCCDGKRDALHDLCAYSRRKSASEEQTEEARLFSPEEAKLLVECLNEAYVTGAP